MRMRNPHHYRNFAKSLALFSVITTFAVLPGNAQADEVVRKDGKTFHGNIVSVDDKVLVLEIVDSTWNMKMQIARADIASFQRDVFYLAAPLHGPVGVQVTADSVSKILQSAREKNAKYVVLNINVSGGSTEEASKIATVLTSAKDLTVVGLVGVVSGAGTIVAFGCKHLVMTAWGHFDGDVPSDEQEQKDFNKELVTLAGINGHPALMARALSQNGMVVSIVPDGNKKKLVEGEVEGGKVLGQKSRSMFLSAENAVASGLANGLASDPSTVGKAIGIPAWRDYAGTGVVKSELVPPSRPKGNDSSSTSSSYANSASSAGSTASSARSTPSGPAIHTLGGAEQQYRSNVKPLDQQHNDAMAQIQRDYASNPAGRRAAELSEDAHYAAQKDQARKQYEKSR